MIKNALVMCGGKASRFRGVDKSLVKLKGKSTIEYLLTSLKKVGIIKPVFVCNEKNKDEIEKIARKYFKDYVIIQNPPERFREGIKHAEKYLDNWFLFVAGNHPIESKHFFSMMKKQRETDCWIVTLYDQKVSNENIFVSKDNDLKIVEGDDFIMQHPLILSKEILLYQQRERFNLKIEKTIRNLISNRDVYGIFANFPPEFDNKEMFSRTKTYVLNKHRD